MKSSRSLILFFLLIFQLTLLAQVTEEWVRRYNNSENGPDHSHALAVDNIGNVYVTGHSNFINSWPSYDYITVKYNNQGVEQWVARYTGEFRFDDAYAIAVDNSGNVYVTGSTETEPFINDFLTVKYNSNGIEQWTRRYNGSLDSNDEANEVVVDNNGDILVSGTANYWNQQTEAVIIKYSPDGTTQWIKSFRGSNGLIHIDNNNNIFFSTGYAIFKLSPQGSVIWQISDTLIYYGALKLDNNLYLIANKIRYNNLNSEYFISKIDLNGNTIWEIPFANAFSKATIDQFGDIYGGYLRDTSGQNNSFQYTIIKLNPAGAFQWQRTFTGGFYFRYMGLAVDLQNKLYVTYSGGNGDHTDFVTMKIDELGNNNWQMTYGSANFTDSPGDIELDNQGNVFVTGYSNSPATGLDYCVVKYSQLIGINPISSEIPNTFSLSQNYPNPFNPVTKIRFALPPSPKGEGLGVRVIIYDILGREISTLVNEQLKPGTYEVTWDAANFPSGVYFYKLITTEYTESKKMILLK